jgi:flagella basal body P-ring formation protein FlgA
MNLRNCVLALQLLCGSAALCHASVDKAQLGQIVGAIEQLLQQQTVGLPGRVSFSVGAIDRNLNLSVCAAPEAFMAPGARVWGNTSVGVRCVGASPWTIYVPVSVRVMAGVVVAAHPLTQGRAIVAADLTLQEADLGLLPGAVMTDAGQAIGRVVTVGVAAGQPLRQDLLRAPLVIQQGQSVTLRAQGAGFKVSAAGKALTNAVEGQIAQVRTLTGNTVNGVARPGFIVDVQ